MKNCMKALLVTIVCIGMFVMLRAEETVTETTSVVTVNGELSTDITFGDAPTFTSPYTGLSFSGDNWVVSTNLLDGEVNIEEAYKWNYLAKANGLHNKDTVFNDEKLEEELSKSKVKEIQKLAIECINNNYEGC